MLVYFLPLLCWTQPCLPPPTVVREVTSGRDAGLFRLTHYWLAQESRKGRPTVTLQLKKRRRKISAAFAKSLRLQGSGLLRNGALVQYIGRCEGRPKDTSCLRGRRVNQRRFPLGKGSSGVPLLPFRSLAVDPRKLPLGSRLYIPSLQRWFRWHGLQHDGCFVTDDEGGRILRKRLDLFAGTKRLFRRFFKHLPRHVRVYKQHSQCSGKLRPLRLKKR